MTWLFIPSHCVPESACSTKDSAPHVSFSESGSAPSVTLKGKPLQPRRLLGAWRKNAWMKRLSGLTLSPSTAERGIAAWIASLPVSPASRTPSQAHAKASMTIDGCGSTSTESSATFLLGSFFSKTSGDCFPVEGSRKSSDRWSPSGSIVNGEYWPRQKLGQAISANGSSFWPTATVCGNYNRKGASINSGDGLSTKAKQWMTPMVPNGGRAVSAELVARKGMTQDGAKRTDGLESQVRHWPTATASMMTGAGSSGRDGGMNLQTAAAKWTTPASRDHKGENSADHLSNGTGRLHLDQLPNFVKFVFLPPALTAPNGKTSSETPHTSPRRLNPAFVCWLMGWPWWWMNPGRISFAEQEMVSFRFKLQQHLSCLLGEQGLFEEAA